MARHRTTARAVLPLFLLGALAGTARAHGTPPPYIAFPVVGNVSFQDDFGDPRAQGRHQGNDIMTRRWQPAVAAVNGRVDLQGTRGGTCMVWLHHKTGTTYVYIHLNNDLTAENDNRGGCREGVSWPTGLHDGDFVRRGQLIGYVGDSGDADGIQPHLHFEVRLPRRGGAISPYPYLLRAHRLLYPRPPSLTEPVSLSLSGRFRAITEAGLRLGVRRVTMSNGWRFPLRRTVVLTLPGDALVQQATPDGRVAARLHNVVAGERVTVTTASFLPDFATQLAAPGALAAAQVLLRGR